MAQQPASTGIATTDDLLLKVTAPRVPRHLVARARLHADDDRWRAVVVVQAPAGFGKTSLLAQWRREHLARGGVVAWLSAQRQDDAQRFVQALALAVRVGSARPAFGHTLLHSVPADGLEGVTTWLAEVAQSALDIVLIVDEAERLPALARDALTYLLRNTPSNLQVVVAARADCGLDVDDLAAYGSASIVGPEQLRFRLDETIELLRSRLGSSSMGPDEAARLHEITEGWPLGLQLALSVMAASADPRAELAALAARRGAVREQFIGLMLANLASEDLALLTRLAVLEQIHPGLCACVAQDPAAAERLARLVRDTPIFTTGEATEWMRMHSLARDELRRRFALLPDAEQAALHARASSWLADHGMVDAAAHHALAAGQNDLAYDLAERSLYESVMTRGRHGAVLEWLTQLPATEIDHRPRLLLAAAWTLALSDRHEEASRFVERILVSPSVDDALRCECALILGGAAVFADDPDRFAALHDPWASNPPLRDPLLLRAHTNRAAFRLLIEGEPAQARQRQQQAPQDDCGAALGYVAHWGEWIAGLSYLWEGQVRLAEDLLRPALARTEAELGRRNPFACTMAAALAAALWERDAPAQAAAALANRLDVLEHGGLPEAVLLGFRTMARIAGAEGAEHRALELLGALDAVAVARRLPRLRIASLSDQVRLHSHRFRPETCRELCERIDALLADIACPPGRLWRRSATLLREVALGHAEIAARQWRRAVEPLARADAIAQQLKLGRLHIELLGLRAWALDRSGERSLEMLREAAGLARTYGLERVFVDAHPALGDWARQVLADPSAPRAGEAGPLAAPIRAAPLAGEAERLRSMPSMALTPKEREVLELLARNLSNKEIGLAMQVGETTVKWHMKNLFAKLDAGTRKQLVQRARILGLLDSQA